MDHNSGNVTSLPWHGNHTFTSQLLPFYPTTTATKPATPEVVTVTRTICRCVNTDGLSPGTTQGVGTPATNQMPGLPAPVMSSAPVTQMGEGVRTLVTPKGGLSKTSPVGVSQTGFNAPPTVRTPHVQTEPGNQPSEGHGAAEGTKTPRPALIQTATTGSSNTASSNDADGGIATSATPVELRSTTEAGCDLSTAWARRKTLGAT